MAAMKREETDAVAARGPAAVTRARARPGSPASGSGSASGRRRVAGVAILGLVALGFTARVWGDSLRCGRSLVSTGDTVAEVREACGEPHATEKGAYQRVGLARGKPVRVSRWRYRRGKGRYEGVVVLYRGEVIAIERGERR